MDQNEFLKQQKTVFIYPMLYKYRWFFIPILKTPPWQRYLLTFLLCILAVVVWWVYWYLPLQATIDALTQQEQRTAVTTVAQEDLRELHKQNIAHYQQLYPNIIKKEQAITAFITTVLHSATQQSVVVHHYAPVTPIKNNTLPEGILIYGMALTMECALYDELLAFINNLVQEYPTLQILDMLIAKQNDMLHITLEITWTHTTHEISDSDIVNYVQSHRTT